MGKTRVAQRSSVRRKSVTRMMYHPHYIHMTQPRQVNSHVITTIIRINARIITYQNRPAQTSPCMSKYQVEKEATHPQGRKREIAGPFMHMSCVHTYCLAQLDSARRAGSRVGSPFSLSPMESTRWRDNSAI
jgi:hypothetical protein